MGILAPISFRDKLTGHTWGCFAVIGKDKESKKEPIEGMVDVLIILAPYANVKGKIETLNVDVKESAFEKMVNAHNKHLKHLESNPHRYFDMKNIPKDIIKAISDSWYGTYKSDLKEKEV